MKVIKIFFLHFHKALLVTEIKSYANNGKLVGKEKTKSC